MGSLIGAIGSTPAERVLEKELDAMANVRLSNKTLSRINEFTNTVNEITESSISKKTKGYLLSLAKNDHFIKWRNTAVKMRMPENIATFTLNIMSARYSKAMELTSQGVKNVNGIRLSAAAELGFA